MQELEIAIRVATTEQERIDALLALAGMLLHSDVSRATQLAEEARQASVSGDYGSEPYKKGLAASLQLLGRVKQKAGDYEAAAALLLDSTSAYQTLNDQQMTHAALEQEVALRTQAETKLKTRLGQMMTVLQVFEEVSHTLDIDFVQLIALDAASRLSGANAGFIALHNEAGLQVSRAIGQYTREDQHAILDSEHPLLKRIIADNKAQMFRDITATKDMLPTLSTSQARIIIPLVSRDRCIGLVNLETNRPERFDENVFQLLRLLQEYVSVALDNAQLYQQVHAQLAELQQLYGQVSQLEQLKSDMIQVAAHDLRNPLAVIYGNLKLLNFDRDMFTDEQGEYIDAIEHSAVRMKTMMEDILSLERIEQMAQADSGKPFNIVQQVQKAVDEYRPQAESKLQAFDAGGNIQAVLMAFGDAPQIYEAIANLIGNAIKYTPEKGHIDVSLNGVSERIVFKVTDTGYGIPDNMQKRLFQPFYRAKTDETQHIEGTGLGLHLVKNIIERHKGKMIFESTYGKGSTFGFSLPRYS